jgi:hypothetical protein
VMGLTIPFALAWGAVLTGISVGVHARNEKKAAPPKDAATLESEGREGP